MQRMICLSAPTRRHPLRGNSSVARSVLLLLAFVGQGCTSSESNEEEEADPSHSTDSEASNPQDTDSENPGPDASDEGPQSTGKGESADETSANPTQPVTPEGERLGGFVVQLDPTSTSFIGLVYGTVPNQTVAHEVLASEGDCEVRKPKVFSCSPACTGSAQCTTESKCVDAALPVSVGEITVSGIGKKDGSTSFAAAPLNPTTQRYNVAQLAVPPFAAGDPISIVAPGGELEPFTLNGQGIAALTLADTTPVPFESGKASTITWEPDAASDARMILTLDVGHHGGSTAEIYCAVEDTGSYTIPAALVTALSEQGVSGFPLAHLERRTTTYANTRFGHVDLVIGSLATLDLAIPGIVSCGKDSECPDGQLCMMPNLQCVPE